MLAMFALFLLLPAVLPRFGYTYLGTEVMIWAIFALGYNLLLGYTGLPAFGHGAFFGIGGYLLGMTQKWVTGGLVLPLAAAAAGTLLLGAVVALFVARRRGIYFSLLTIAFGVMFWFMVFVFDAWTGGEDGLTGINRLAVLGYALRDNVPFYYFVYAWFVGATVVLWRIVNSPFGQVIRAIRQSETRARAVGYDTARYKWAVFTLSCGFAGLAGGLYALARFGAFAEPMSLSQSGNVVLMCLIGGGFASFYGPVLGVVVFLVAARRAVDPDRPLDARLRRPVHGGHPLHARGHPRRRPAAPSAGRIPRHGRGPGGPRARVLDARPVGRARASASRDRRLARRAGSAPVLETRGLRKAFGGHVVLDGVDLAFEPGRLSALIGPNGAGKTTCFNLLTGFLAADAGEIRFKGQDVTRLPPHRRARLGICRSFQILNLFDDDTVLENVRVAVPAMRARGFDCWTPADAVSEAEDRAAADRAPDRPRRARARRRPLPLLRPAAAARDRRRARRGAGAAPPRRADERSRDAADGDAPRAGPAALRAAHDRRDRARHGLRPHALAPRRGAAPRPGHRGGAAGGDPGPRRGPRGVSRPASGRRRRGRRARDGPALAPPGPPRGRGDRRLLRRRPDPARAVARGPGGRDGLPPRPERARQDDHDQEHPRAGPGPPRDGSSSTAPTSPGCRRTSSRGGGSPGCRTIAASSRRSPWSGTSPWR